MGWSDYREAPPPTSNDYLYHPDRARLTVGAEYDAEIIGWRLSTLYGGATMEVTYRLTIDGDEVEIVDVQELERKDWDTQERRDDRWRASKFLRAVNNGQRISITDHIIDGYGQMVDGANQYAVGAAGRVRCRYARASTDKEGRIRYYLSLDLVACTRSSIHARGDGAPVDAPPPHDDDDDFPF